MAILCAVVGCGNNNGRDKSKKFFRIPAIVRNSDPDKREEKLTTKRRNQWLKNISRDDLSEEKANYTRVCSDHFISGRPSKQHEVNDPDWAPTQRMGHNKIKPQTTSQLSRSIRSQERAAKRTKIEAAKMAAEVERSVQASIAECQDTNSAPQPELTRDHHTGIDVECQTDMTSFSLMEMEKCLETMTVELSELKKKLMETGIEEKSFLKSDEKTRFYTGLPNFLVFQQVLAMCSPYIYSGSVNSLCKFQELLLTLMRLRLNLCLEDLAYRFNISTSTASRVFDKWLEVLSVRLQFLIVWPERDQLIEAMPMCFKVNYGNRVAVIIDCFEVFINRPSSLIARAITWSNYKHHNTVKFLIGITPHGVISFISKAWGGRASDKHVTEHCGILKKLTPGDLVLADRGFDIAESVGLYHASLKTPAFTRGKKQLSAHEIEDTRKIANVRIHVERVIGLVRRKYVILQSILPVDLVTVRAGQSEAPIDKIAKVCCALTNLSESVVPFN